MSHPDVFAAELLELSAAGYASLATQRLLARHPDVEQRFAPDAFAGWKAALTQRLVELAAALRIGEPEIFRARVDWARKAFGARGVPVEDLRASLESLAGVLEEELPESARQAPGALLAGAIETLAAPPVEETGGLNPARAEDRLALEYLAAVLEGDSGRATARVLAAVDAGLPVETAYMDVLIPAQREVGRLWHSGELGVAEEHVVSYTTQRLMALLAARAERAAPSGRTVLCAAVAGNIHDIGVRVIADFFEIAGWRVVYLGANLPAADLVSAVQYFDGDLVVLSAALSVQLARLDETIQAVRRIERRRVRVMVGGLAFADAPEVWKKLGADGYSPDAREAVRLGSRLLA